MVPQIWTNPDVMEWSQLLLNSFRHWTGHELLERVGDPDYQAHALFLSPFVVVSHGMEEDPLINYGNQVALELWEMTWEDLTRTPSRLTAEPPIGLNANGCWSKPEPAATSTPIKV